MKLGCIQFLCFNFFFLQCVLRKLPVQYAALCYCIFLVCCWIVKLIDAVSLYVVEVHHVTVNVMVHVVWYGKTDSCGLWGRAEMSQSKAMLKSVLKLRRSTEYMLSAEHSYSPASICVAGSISSFDFTLSGPIFHSWTCKPRHSLL